MQPFFATFTHIYLNLHEHILVANISEFVAFIHELVAYMLYVFAS